MDCSPSGSSVSGISQARILKWAAISFSRGSSWSRDQTHDSCIAGGLLHWRKILYSRATGRGLSDSVLWATHTHTHVYTYIYSFLFIHIYTHIQEEGAATHFSVLACSIPWIEEPGRLQSMGSQRVGHNWGNLARVRAHAHTHTFFSIMVYPRRL